MSDDGDEILETFGRPVTFRGTVYSVLISQNPLEQSLSDGGFIFKAGFNIRMLIKAGSALASNRPRQGEIFTYDGREYTITTVTYRPPSPWFDTAVISSTQ